MFQPGSDEQKESLGRPSAPGKCSWARQRFNESTTPFSKRFFLSCLSICPELMATSWYSWSVFQNKQNYKSSLMRNSCPHLEDFFTTQCQWLLCDRGTPVSDKLHLLCTKKTVFAECLPVTGTASDGCRRVANSNPVGGTHAPYQLHNRFERPSKRRRTASQTVL